jgi:hypothetical protein
MIKKMIESLFVKIQKALFLFYKQFTYHTIKDMDFTMRHYIPLVVDYDFNSIRRIKIPIPQKHLFRIYEGIMFEYIELSNNKELLAKIKEKDTLLTLYRKQNILSLISYVLSCKYASKEAKEQVKNYLKKNRIVGKDALSAVEAEIKTLHVKIDMIQEKEKKNESNKVERADFFCMFALLEKNGYNANLDMPVIQYIQVLDLYRKEMKQLENLNSKNG